MPCLQEKTLTVRMNRYWAAEPTTVYFSKSLLVLFCFSCIYFFMHLYPIQHNFSTFGNYHFFLARWSSPPPRSEGPPISAYLHLLFLGADTTSLGLWPRSWKCSDSPNKKQGWSKHTGRNITKTSLWLWGLNNQSLSCGPFLHQQSNPQSSDYLLKSWTLFLSHQ